MRWGFLPVRSRVMKHLAIVVVYANKSLFVFISFNAGREYLSTRSVGTQLGLGHAISTICRFWIFWGVFCTKNCGKLLGTQEHTENHQRPEIRNPETRVGVSPPWCMTHGAGVTPIPARCLQNSLKKEATDIPVLLPDLLCCGQTPNPVLLWKC